jgi:hypothetical protein
MRFARFVLVAIIFVLGLATSMHAQEHAQQYGRVLFNVGGGVGFPQGSLSSFVNAGGNFVIGGGVNLAKYFGVDTEFMWQDLPVNSATKALLQTSGATAREFSWTFNPMLHVPLGHHLGAYAIGGIGWYRRSGETTTPGTGVICDPYWSWWYGCTIGTVNFVTSSRTSNSFGENIGGGFTYRLGESHAKLYAEVRYHHAAYHTISTQLLPLTFGIRW